MTPIHETKKFTIYFYGSIVVVVWFAVVASSAGLGLPDPFVALRALSAGALVAYLFSLAMDRWLWRLPLLQKVFGVPDVSGRWEGWYWNALGQQWLANAHEIAQHSWRISYHSWGPMNESSSVCATLLTDGHGKTELATVYATKALSGQTEPHRGASNLSLSRASGETRLIGTYWTDRMRDDGTKGQYGYIRLVRVRKEKKNMNGLSYAENDWAMPKPNDPPERFRPSTIR